MSEPATADWRELPTAEGTVVFVCTACRREGGQEADTGGEPERPGAHLARQLGERLAGAAGISVRTVECLAVCKRPCTIALTAPYKWTYVVGDLEAGAHLEDVVAMARAYAESINGIVAWKARPPAFRKGVVARCPPFGFSHEEAAP